MLLLVSRVIQLDTLGITYRIKLPIIKEKAGVQIYGTTTTCHQTIP